MRPLLAILVLALLILAAACEEPVEAPADDAAPAATATVGSEAEATPTTNPEDSYRFLVGLVSTLMGESLSEFGALASGPDLLDASWRSDMFAVIDDIEAASVLGLESTSPSQRFNPMHEKWTASLNLMVTSMQLMREGIEELDTEKINQANSALQTATRVLGEAAALIPE